MRRASWLLLLGVIAALPVSAAHLAEIQRIALPEISGRIDHMAFDDASGRLVVAALGNNSVEIIDVRSGRVARSVAGIKEPQGVLIHQGKALVAAGAARRGVLVNLQDGRVERSIELPDDPDNVRADPEAGLVYVGAGEGVLDIFSAGSLQPAGQIALPGHPESFQVVRGGARLYVNVPSVHAVIVADGNTRREIARWSLPAAANFPMALDEGHARLFVITRSPAQLHVLDLPSGYLRQTLAAVGDADDVFYDAEHSRLFAIGGEGFVDVFEDVGGQLVRTERVPTRAGARTGLWVPSLQRLFVALPRRGKDAAELRVFRF